MTSCKPFVETAEMLRGTNPCQNTIESLSRAMSIAECCRSEGRDDLAIELVEHVAKFPLAQEGTMAARVYAFYESVDTPSVLVKGWNFTKHMAWAALHGFPRASEETIKHRLSICEACEHRENEHCKLCGCKCELKNHLMNKLAHAGTTCPIGKW